MHWLFFFSFLGFGNTDLMSLEVSLLLDASGANHRVFFIYMNKTMKREAVVYDFEKRKTTMLDQKISGSRPMRTLVHDHRFYVVSGTRLGTVNDDGSLGDIIDLTEFDGWEEGLKLEEIEDGSGRIVALLSRDDHILAGTIDPSLRKITLIPIDLPENDAVALPEYMLMPFGENYICLEEYSAQVVLMGPSLTPLETLQEAGEVVRVPDKRFGGEKEIKIFSRPLIATAVGVSGKHLRIDEKSDNQSRRVEAGGFSILTDKTIVEQASITIGSHAGKQLLWDREQGRVYLSE